MVMSERTLIVRLVVVPSIRCSIMLLGRLWEALELDVLDWYDFMREHDDAVELTRV